MIRPVRGRPVFALDKVAPDTDDSVSKLQTGPERRRAYLKSDGKGGGARAPRGSLVVYGKHAIAAFNKHVVFHFWLFSSLPI